MEALSRSSARLVRLPNHAVILSPSRRHISTTTGRIALTSSSPAHRTTTPTPTRTQPPSHHRRPLSTTPSPSNPQPSLFSPSPSSSLSSPSSSGNGQPYGPPTSYFTPSRPSLPANTIIRFVPQQTAWVVERMGKFNRILEPGLAVLIPFLDRIAYVRSLKESAIEIPSQNAITADNVTLELDGVLYTRVFDAYKASYGVEDAEYAISQLAQTTMRSEIGQLTLDHVLKERAMLNTNITQAINEAAQDWGVVCLRYEIRDIHAPEGVVAAMHRQVTAERSKRAEILDSEGQRQSAINIAEGRKQSVILASEALKSEQINMAAGEAEAIKLRAQATARGIDSVAKAISDGEESARSAVSLTVAEKYVDAFGKLAKEGTAVVVPGNVGDIGGMIASAMAVYGKVNEGQAKVVAKKAIEGGSKSVEGGGATRGRLTDAEQEQLEHAEDADYEGSNPEVRSGEVAQSVLEGFEQARERKDFEVYSCHVSPDGKRLVTAAGDGHVRIWSTDAIYNASDPAYADKPKQLASMSNHSGTIHTVRFSPNGKYVASGADDKIVCVYMLEANPPSHSATFGTNEPPPVENWRTIRRLIGHDNDVQDLGWSWDSSILVSVGLDSKVVVWSGHTFEKLKVLSNHQSHVKGITFDPANKYFATASDDRTVRVFRFTSPAPNAVPHDQMNNFVLDHIITAPFVNSPLTTYFRRCSWSPDGMHVAAANAVNGPVSSVAIINRGSWDSDINLIGHEGPVEVCAFSPRLYSREPVSKAQLENPGQPIQNLVTVIACAGGDKSLSVWITSNPRPIVITQDIAAKSISDLSWTPDGRCLYATALDGSILAVRFEDAELGYAMDFEQNEKSLSKFGTNRRGAGIVESTDGLLLEEKSKAGEIRGVQGRMGALMGDGHSGDHAGDGAAAILPSNGATPAGASTPVGDAAKAAQTNGTANGTGAPAPATAAEPDKPDPHAEKLERLKQRPTYTKEGKKRIAPLLVSGAGGAESSLPQSRLVAAAASQGAKSDAPESILDLSKPFDGLPKGGLAALLLGNKRKLAQIEGDEEGVVEKRVALASQNGATPIMTNGPDGVLPAQPVAPVSGQQPTPEFIRPAVLNPCMEVSQVRLAVPKVRNFILQGVDSGGNPVEVPPGSGSGDNTSSKSRADLVFEARNPPPGTLTGRSGDREPVRMTLTRGDQPLWQDFLPKAVLLVTGNQKMWAAATEDASIYIWTPSGRRLVSALVLEAQPVILECNDSYILCITAVGMCYVWNIKNLTSPHPPVSLQPVLDAAIHNLTSHTTPAPAIKNARINSEGRIIVAVSNGDGYSYNPSMYVWQRLSEAWWAVGSQYWNTTDASVGNLQSSGRNQTDADTTKKAVSAGIIPFLERNTTNEALFRGRGYFLQRLIKVLLSREGFESFESSVSIAHLENRVAAAMSLGAREEFRIYLSMYAKRLGAEGLRLKVEDLLRSLLGGIFEDDDEEGGKANGGKEGEKSDMICGWSRQVLLKEVIVALGKHRDLQRVIVPYAQLLGVIDEVENQEDAMVTS
ncbi:HIR complex subunit [Arachnomyces sp. PD_36]|nr:HIR complex subunit [Arachnomyces sp. PD_36]